jgi:hypothetical protein
MGLKCYFLIVIGLILKCVMFQIVHRYFSNRQVDRHDCLQNITFNDGGCNATFPHQMAPCSVGGALVTSLAVSVLPVSAEDTVEDWLGLGWSTAP